MAGRDIQIPFGPDKTGGIPLDAIPAQDDVEEQVDPFADPSARPAVNGIPDPAAYSAPTQGQTLDPDYRVPDVPANEPASSVTFEPVTLADEPASLAQDYSAPAYADTRDVVASQGDAQGGFSDASTAVQVDGDSADDEYRPGGYTDEEAAAQGMDEMQMSILALKDSIGQGRELKEREKEREELAEALKADHLELSDREAILSNYHELVAAQDAIIADCTQRRDAAKAELAQLTMSLEQTQAQLESVREQHAAQMQPIESDLGRARAAADQAKNDERSRKSELNAAESELRKASDSEANTMAVARHQQVKAAYDEARARSEQAKEYLAQVQKAYDDAKRRSEQASGPLERNIADMKNRMEAIKKDIEDLGEKLSAATNRRQYCDTVYQYPDETAKMRAEVEQAEALARQMDAENEALRSQYTQSKKKATKAKIAIGVVIVIIIVIIVAFVVVSGR